MSFYDRLKQRDQRIEAAEKKLGREITGMDKQLLILVEAIAIGLGVSAAGKLLFSVANIRKARGILTAISSFWKSRQKETVTLIVEGLNSIFDANVDYFKEMASLPTNAEDEARKRLLLVYGYDVEKDEILKGGWFDNISPVEALNKEIAIKVNQAFAARMSLKDLRGMLRRYLAPPGGSGLVSRYFNQQTFDLFQQFDRLCQEHFKELLGLRFFIYAGTRIETSRDFCKQRANNIYEDRIIDEWENMTWAGKHKYLPVKIALGGYNCRHHRSFVSDEIAERIIAEKGLNALSPI